MDRNLRIDSFYTKNAKPNPARAEVEGGTQKESMMKAIEVNNLKKSFGEFQAVQGVSFSAEVGEVLSLSLIHI